MFTPEQLEERKNYIGASEAAAVIGKSRWKSPLEVWAEKTGLLPIEQKENIPAEVGTELEDYIARKFSKITGKKVHKINEPYIMKQYPFIRCHIDRKVEGERAILQCKTCSAFKYREWQDEDIPADYVIQEFHELACSGYNKAYIAILIGNHDFKIKEIIRDMQTCKAIDKLISLEVEFWNKFVIPKIQPQIITAQDGDVLEKMYPLAKQGAIIQLSDKVNALIESLEGLSQDKKALETEITKLKNELKAMIKENETGNTGLYKVQWKNIHKDSYTVPEQNYRQIYYHKIEEKEA